MSILSLLDDFECFIKADGVKDCYLKDPKKFDSCLLTFWAEIKPILPKGIPELNVPPLEPLSIENIQFSEQGTVVQVTATFSKVLVKGASNHEVKSLVTDLPNKSVTISIFFPALYITGQYDINGTILYLPVQGKGPFTLNLTNIDSTAVGHMIKVGNKAKIDRLDVEFKIQGINVGLEGLLGDDTVGEAVRNMLNDNSQQILDDVKPKVQRQLADTIMKTLQGSFVDLPPEALGLL